MLRYARTWPRHSSTYLKLAEGLVDAAANRLVIDGEGSDYALRTRRQGAPPNPPKCYAQPPQGSTAGLIFENNPQDKGAFDCTPPRTVTAHGGSESRLGCQAASNVFAAPYADARISTLSLARRVHVR